MNSFLNYIHSGGSLWCRYCCVEAQLEYAKEQAARIPKLEEELMEINEKNDDN